jgi:hypothetical protein
MPPIDYTIPGQIRPLQIEPPMNAMARAMELRNMQDAAQMNALKRQEYQRGVQQRNALAAIHSDPNVKLGTPEYFTRVQQDAPDLYESEVTRAQQRSELEEKVEKRKFENFERKFGLFKTLLPSVQNEYDVVEYTRAAYSDPDLKPYLEAIRPLERAIETNTAEFYRDPDNWRMQASGVSAEKLAEIARDKSKPMIVSPGGTLVSPTGEALFTAPKEFSPSEMQKNYAAAKEDGFRGSFADFVDQSRESETEREYRRAKDAGYKGSFLDFKKQVAVANKVVVNAAGPALSKDALDLAADQFLVTGTIPPVNRGDRSAIVNRAAAMAKEKGMDPSVVDRMANKSNQAALTQLTKQETMVGAFEKNFVKNVGIVERISQKKDSTGVPVLQKWINVGKKAVSGDPELASLAVAIKAVQNEYGKIVSGSMGNTAVAVSEIKRMEDLLNAAQTPQDVMAVLNTMREETQNRMAGFKEQKAELTGAIRGTTKPPANAAAPFTDAEKERRYQAWKAQQGQGKAKP